MAEKEFQTSKASHGLKSVNDPEARAIISPASSDAKRYYASPPAWEDQQLYFLLPDRFSNGKEDGALDVEGKPAHGEVKAFSPADNGNAITTRGEAKSWEENGTIFQGGTIRGIKSKLGYLEGLGITALWIGPIFKQVPNDDHLYHGYAVQNFLEVDPHFGSKEDLCELVRDAHQRGIYVILDIILNHSGDVFAYKGGERRWNGHRFEVEGFRDSAGKPSLPFRQLEAAELPKDAADCAIWPAELQDTGTFTCEGAISNWDYWPEYIRGDFLSLKDIDLGPDAPDGFAPTRALQALCEVYKYWIAYADLDGYRIDTVKHMGDGPTRYLCTTLHEYASALGKERFFLVGEVTGPRAFDTVEVTGLDAALGIGHVQETLWKLPKGLTNPADYFDLFRNATYLKKGTNAWMRDKVVTMIDDHDQVWRGGSDKARFCSDPEGARLALAALALNLTTLGIPCIYYGTEQLLDGRGGNDRFIREAMFGGSFGAFRSKYRHVFNESNSVYKEVAKICKLRQQNLTLRRGRQYIREVSADGKGFGVPHILGGRMKSIVAWSRIFADEEILCAINTDTKNTLKAFVTIDAKLHSKGDKLKAMYRSPVDEGSLPPEKIEVLEMNGKAVSISVPPGGFVMYK